FMDSVHHIWCPLFSQEFQDLPDGAETTLTVFLSLTIILLDIHPMKLPQSWWWELKLRREGVNN
ncbi:hypothetical protein, partial [Escherichia coli]|uniref:hypothetical protein n=1 Tax=Escherichia coli TaxID=562 RepID=UPI0006B4B501